MSDQASLNAIVARVDGGRRRSWRGSLQTSRRAAGFGVLSV
jgi:hypothetical protein